MRAVTFSEYGGPDVLVVGEVDTPEPGAGQVRIAVRAVGVNPMDIKIRNGDLQQVMPLRFPAQPGSEVSGVVDAVGPGVGRLAVGDEVLALTDGGAYAEYALASLALPKPASLSWEEGAALPVVAGTAYRCLGEVDLEAGQTLLVHGAAGSVGSAAVQLAHGRDLILVGTARPDDLDYVRGLGATAVAYGDGWVDRVREAAPQGVDAVLDTSGAGVLRDSVALVGGTEHVVTIADAGAQQVGVRFSAGDPDDKSPGALPELIDLAGRGRLRIRVWRGFPLAEAADAQRAVEDHSARGKVVLVP